MDADTKTLIKYILLILISVLILILYLISRPRNSFGDLPNNMDDINTNMQWIGKVLASGELYCVDNVGIDLVENGTKTWVSMKEICNIIITPKKN